LGEEVGEAQRDERWEMVERLEDRLTLNLRNLESVELLVKVDRLLVEGEGQKSRM